ncbi:Fic/DOC family protein [Candidatus Thiothrix anitrata]|uniref:protein adenylyltransferase n=1 Tax=Candidatus Thiothrix anitrata TaxID=2823902 RepID=A0ABX7X0K2_9GAMM|nr:Fic family protein [Candidatus Thiothrix anitrata]QTR49481.1 Fic family protein [Candidatus Thiothrix anitrata]
MSDKYGVSQDPDCYPNSSVLVNKLNIRDAQELEAVEAELTQLRSESFEPDFAAFDLGVLAAIHRHLFQDIYPWAGQLRTVDISKGTTRFCSAQYIQKEADRLLARLQSEQWLEGLALLGIINRRDKVA